ncbi:uncharacterized protein LOC115271502, partial [Terrapene carolina triunguis]|uniref:uncharacterized protein LOC115271502 n=1 Tax=Terrapene triunguis TaxID=2587831 RepID=UPI001156C1C2
MRRPPRRRGPSLGGSSCSAPAPRSPWCGAPAGPWGAGPHTPPSTPTPAAPTSRPAQIPPCGPDPGARSPPSCPPRQRRNGDRTDPSSRRSLTAAPCASRPRPPGRTPAPK